MQSLTPASEEWMLPVWAALWVLSLGTLNDCVSGMVGVTLPPFYKSGHMCPISSGVSPAIQWCPSIRAGLTVGRGGEDEGLAAVDANVAQVV